MLQNSPPGLPLALILALALILLQILLTSMFWLLIVCSFWRLISSLQFKNMSGGILPGASSPCHPNGHFSNARAGAWSQK